MVAETKPIALDNELVAEQREWVLMLTNVILIVLSVTVLAVQVKFSHAAPGDQVYTTSGVIVLSAMVSLLLLRMDRYSAAAHLVVGMTFAGIWYANIHVASNVDVKSESVYIIAALALPALLLGRWWTVAYGTASALCFGYITAMLVRKAHVSSDTALGFALDNVVAVAFMVYFFVLISLIYERAIDRVRSLMDEQRESIVTLKEMAVKIEENELQKRHFYRETIYSVTGGKLGICDESDVAYYLEHADFSLSLPDSSHLSSARHSLSKYCLDAGILPIDTEDYVLAVGEALTNALKHGGSGEVHGGRNEVNLWMAVTDHGVGIESLILPRALLMKGFSTAPSLGIGYTIMLDSCDQLLLQTGPSGTTVVLIKRLAPVRKVSLEMLPDTW